MKGEMAYATKTEGPISSAFNAFDRIFELEARIENVVNRLVGCRPPAPASTEASLKPIADGLLPNLQERAAMAHLCMDRISREINRLDDAA